MKKLILGCLTLLAAFTTADAQGLTFDYVSHVGGAGANVKSSQMVRDRSLAIDKDGYIYSFGIMSGGATEFDVLSGGRTLNPNDGELFIAKYDTLQNLIWVKQIGGVATTNEPNAIALDSAGNIYLGGTFGGVIDLSTGPNPEYVSVRGSLDGYVVKLDSAGDFVWGKSIGDVGASVQLQALTVNAGGDIFATGNFVNTVRFDLAATNATLSGSGTYVLKLDTKGDFGWVRHLENSSGYSIALDRDGNVLPTARLSPAPRKGTPFNPIPDFDPSPAPADTFFLRSFGDEDIFVSKLDQNGDFVWARNFGGKSRDEGFSIVVDDEGAVYTTGSFYDTADFNPWGSSYKMVSPKSTGMFVSKIDADGNFVWAKQLGGEGDQRGFSVDVGEGRGTGAYVTGDFKGTTTFYNKEDTFILDGGSGSTFLIKLDTAGTFESSYATGGTISSTVVVDKKGNVFTAGWFNTDTADFNPLPDDAFVINKIGDLDGFVHKMRWCSFGDTIQTSVCREYVYGDTVFYQTGVYALINPEGCNSSSLMVLDLIIFNLDPEIAVEEDTLSTTGSYHSYQWMKDGQIIVDARDDRYVVTENGNYQVIVGNEEGCADTSEVYRITNKTDIKQNNPISSLVVFPNPASDIVHISSPLQVNIQLVSMEGKILTDEKNVKTFSIAHLPYGIYFLKIFDEEGELLKTTKLVK